MISKGMGIDILSNTKAFKPRAMNANWLAWTTNIASLIRSMYGILS